MKNVRYIPAKTIEHSKIRVAVYCRVSTSGSVQLGSLEIQIETYSHMIESCPDWIFVGMFYDIGSDLRRTEKVAKISIHNNFIVIKGKNDTEWIIEF